MLPTITSKIFNWETISIQMMEWRKKGKSVVFTNGCFDILHYGHVHYLAEAKALGDRLLIGLNADVSVRRLKGKHRPINSEQSRQYLLAALQCVDGVILFEEDTPYNLIQLVQPDVLVKGGDWTTEQIVGADIVLKNGGIVQSLAFIDGYSTTNIESKIRNSKT